MLMANTEQLLDVLHELELCYRGESKYAGDTAEIYAFRLLPHSPGCTGPPPRPGDIFWDEYKKRAHGAAEALGAVLTKFMEFYPKVKIMIDENEPFDALHPVAPFAHRVHVQVIRDED